MKQYLELLERALNEGVKKADRTGTGTRSLFAPQMRFDLSKGFPLLTTKKLHIRSIIHELLWFLSGKTNIKYLKDNGVKIWDAWADENGDLGPVYGAQWRNFNGDGIDQIQTLIEGLKTDPDSRRHLVVAWNPSKIDQMALPPCHCLFQFWIANGNLSCQLYQRSADILIGIPFNISCYSLLTHMIAQQIGLNVGEFVWTGGDVHLYENHVEQAKEQLKRIPKDLPCLMLRSKPATIFDYKFEDFHISGYTPDPSIKASVAV